MIFGARLCRLQHTLEIVALHEPCTTSHHLKHGMGLNLPSRIYVPTDAWPTSTYRKKSARANLHLAAASAYLWVILCSPRHIASTILPSVSSSSPAMWCSMRIVWVF